MILWIKFLCTYNLVHLISSFNFVVKGPYLAWIARELWIIKRVWMWQAWPFDLLGDWWFRLRKMIKQRYNTTVRSRVITKKTAKQPKFIYKVYIELQFCHIVEQLFRLYGLPAGGNFEVPTHFVQSGRCNHSGVVWRWVESVLNNFSFLCEEYTDNV